MKQAIRSFFGIMALCYIVLFFTAIILAPIAGVIVLANLVNVNFYFCLFIAVPMTFALIGVISFKLAEHWNSLVDKLSGINDEE